MGIVRMEWMRHVESRSGSRVSGSNPHRGHSPLYAIASTAFSFCGDENLHQVWSACARPLSPSAGLPAFRIRTGRSQGYRPPSASGFGCLGGGIRLQSVRGSVAFALLGLPFLCLMEILP